MEGLAPQAFASNNLDRSVTERRQQAFLKTIFPDSLMLIVSDGKVLVYSNGSKAHLRWFQPFELQNLAYEMGDTELYREKGTLLRPMSICCTYHKQSQMYALAQHTKAICKLLFGRMTGSTYVEQRTSPPTCWGRMAPRGIWPWTWMLTRWRSSCPATSQKRGICATSCQSCQWRSWPSQGMRQPSASGTRC